MSKGYRRECITQKIGSAETGLAGGLFAHVEHEGGRVVTVRFSHKWKDDSGIDRALAALGDCVTSIAREIQSGEKT